MDSPITLDSLLNDPSVLFTKNDDDFLNCDKLLESLKEIIDPVIKNTENNVLDEIYVDGLDSTQVWGQVKLVFDNVEKSVWDEIDEFKSRGRYVEDGEIDDEEDDEEVGGDESVDSEEVAFGEREDGDDNEDEDEEEDEELSDAIESENDQNVEHELSENEEEEEEGEEESASESEENGTGEDDGFGLNDDIFELDDYKRQVLALEDNDFDNNDDDEDVDLFADLSDENEEDEEMYTYNDFFDPSNKDLKKKNGRGGKDKKKKDKKDSITGESDKELDEDAYDTAFDLAQADIYGNGEEEQYDDDSEEVEENGKEHLSTFEKQQRELQRQIAELEAESIAEKKWTMRGEVSGKQRQADTLLEEDLEFDRTAKPVPVITQETTESIEEIIKRRIINQEFDEIPKRIISELNNFRKSKKVDVSEEKSGKSLAELYEDEYNGGNTANDEVSESLNKAHEEISELFKDITYQLDSLYSSHFVPKPKEKLLDVRIETSTIAMEDAQPLTMAASNTLAPQEVYKLSTKVGKDEVLLRSGVVMAKGELEREDKQRLHRAKKRKQHLQGTDESLKKQKVETSQL